MIFHLFSSISFSYILVKSKRKSTVIIFRIITLRLWVEKEL